MSNIEYNPSLNDKVNGQLGDLNVPIQIPLSSIKTLFDETPPASYKVYTALLTQNGGSDTLSIGDGELTIGVTYYIEDNVGSGWDFTNVGAPNNEIGTYFVATGTTPNSWGIDGLLNYNTGAPVANVAEDTTGLNLYYNYQTFGNYQIGIGQGVSLDDKRVIVFVNSGNFLSENKLVKANYTYEENIFIINSFNDGTQEDDVISDPDNFYRTSIEIRVYN